MTRLRRSRARRLKAFAAAAAATLLVAATPPWDLPIEDPADWVPETNGDVYDIEIIGNTLYMVGEFTTVDGVPRDNLAAFDVNDGTLRSWNPGANKAVLGIDAAADGQSVYVTGKFRQVDGKTRRKVAEIDLNGDVTNWDATLQGGRGQAIMVHGNDVYVGGRFTSVNGSSADAFLTRLDATTGDRIDWAPTLDEDVWDIERADDDGNIWVAGFFRRVNGDGARRGLVEITPGGSLTSFKPADRRNTFDVQVGPAPDRVYVAAGGGGGRLTAYDTTGNGSLLWTGAGDGDFQAVEATPDHVFGGGHQGNYNGSPITKILSADVDTGVPSGWGVNTGGGKGAYELLITDEGLWVAGRFERSGKEDNGGIAFYPAS